MSKNNNKDSQFGNVIGGHTKQIILWLVAFCLVAIAAAGLTYWQLGKKTSRTASAFTENQVLTAKNMQTTGGKITVLGENEITIKTPRGTETAYHISPSVSLAKGLSQEQGVLADLRVGLDVNVSYDANTSTILNISY